MTDRRDPANLQAALFYASLGLPVLPVHGIENDRCTCIEKKCESPGKHPRTRHGFKNATTDVAKIRSWYERWPGDNVGIRTGAESQIVVLDIDPRHGGDDSLGQLVEEFGPLPLTVESITGSRGRHLYFRYPGPPVRNRVKVRPGIDVRADKGYVVAPPSTHCSGQNYSWADGKQLGDMEPVPIPPWLLKVIQNTSRTTRVSTPREINSTDPEILLDAASQYVAKASGVEEGARNASAFNLAGHLAAFVTKEDNLQLTEAQIVDLVMPWNQKNTPPLSDTELQKTVRSAMTNGTARNPHVVKTIYDKPHQASHGEDLPVVILPGGCTPIVHSAAKLGELLAKTNQYYLRGDVVVTVSTSDDGVPRIQNLKASTLSSEFERVASLKKRGRDSNDKCDYVPTICSEQTSKLILNAAAFKEALPVIRVLSPCPVLTERDGALVEVVGFDRRSGIMAAGEATPSITLDTARDYLNKLLCGFRFATPADKSRALAALITPAMVFGGLLGGRAPVDLGEANASQSGKGYRNKLTAAVYRQTVASITQRKGGVGSLEETFNSVLMRGANFICLDNVRDKVDSPAIESFMTEDRYIARVPYEPNVEIDPSRVMVQMTSNKAEITTDLANRSSCVRILKQPSGHEFNEYSEGDILDHVRENQSLVLGAVFRVIREWHGADKPQTKESRHAFRPWVRTLDWIVQNLLDVAPLMEGHRETQERMANPALTWLRDVAIRVPTADLNERWWRAHDVLNLIAAESGVEVPGVKTGDNLDRDEIRETALRGIGRKLSQCFGSGDEVAIDGFVVERQESKDEKRRVIREYRFRAHAEGGLT